MLVSARHRAAGILPGATVLIALLTLAPRTADARRGADEWTPGR